MKILKTSKLFAVVALGFALVGSLALANKASADTSSSVLDWLNITGQSRDLSKEASVRVNYLNKIEATVVAHLPKTVSNGLNDFLTYGINMNSMKIGVGERAAALSSYREVYGVLPVNDDQINNVIRIADGQMPSIVSANSEQKAKVAFQKMYNRQPNFNYVSDTAAINIMAYGTRQSAANRNLNSERAAINSFNNIYHYSPKSAADWNIVQGVAYSGATR